MSQQKNNVDDIWVDTPDNGSFPVSPPFKIPSFMFDLRVFTAKCVMLCCKV